MRGPGWTRAARLRAMAAAGDVLLVGFFADELVEDSFAGFGTQDAPEALDVLTARGGAAQHDGDVGVRHVHAFIQDATGDELGVATGAEAVQHGAALDRWRAVRDARDQEGPADL